jgi:hypothetical protein
MTFDLVIRESLRILLFGHNFTRVFTFVQTELCAFGQLDSKEPNIWWDRGELFVRPIRPAH